MIGKKIDEIKDDTYIFDDLPPIDETKNRIGSRMFPQNLPRDRAGVGGNMPPALTNRRFLADVAQDHVINTAINASQGVYSDPDDPRRQLVGVTRVLQFISGGDATVTIVSKKTDARFTYRCKRPKPVPGKRRPIWVSLLSGSNNESDFAILGTIWESNAGLTYNHNNRKSRIAENAPSAEAIKWLVHALNARNADEALQKCEVWHEGKCRRCGRKLTVPESIESGIGPECATK